MLAEIGGTSAGQPSRLVADDDDFDYVQVDDEPMDESQADILKLRDAIGGAGPDARNFGQSRQGFSSSVLSGTGTKLVGSQGQQSFALSPMKGADHLQLSGGGGLRVSGREGAVNSSSGDLTGGGLVIQAQSACDDIDNPAEMDAIEAGDDELLNECDPETLKEMERRQDEIVEAFLELALNMKHESRERILQKHQAETGQ